MTKRTALSPLACTAIAAVLAVAPTTVFAQETAAPDPAPAANPVPAAAAPAPIVLPEMRAAPVVQAVPEPSAAPEPAAERTTATSVTRSAPRQTARIAAPIAAAPVAAEAVTPTAVPVADIPVTDVVPAEVPPVAAAVPQPAAQPAEDNSAALGLGLLGLVALGGAGTYAIARRRRKVSQPEVIYREEAFAAPAPVLAAPAPIATTTTPARVPAAAATAAPLAFERKPDNAPTSTGSAIPAGPLPTGPALAELYERMVRSAPDAANPFKSDRRRRQRVRWLMKQHEYRLREADDNFDFRHYTTGAQSAVPEEARREVVPA